MRPSSNREFENHFLSLPLFATFDRSPNRAPRFRGKFHPLQGAEDGAGREISGRSPALQAGSPGFKSQPVHSPLGSNRKFLTC